MKVNVLTVEDVAIKKWHWWSNWIDVCIFTFDSKTYLVQMKISRTNAKQFKTKAITRPFIYATTADIGDLTQMKKE